MHSADYAVARYPSVCSTVCPSVTLRRVWQALNYLFIHATFCVIATGARPQGKQKMKAWVRKNDDFLQLWFE